MFHEDYKNEYHAHCGKCNLNFLHTDWAIFQDLIREHIQQTDHFVIAGKRERNKGS